MKGSELQRKKKTIATHRWHSPACVTLILRSLPPELSELINEFSKVAGFKINIQKSIMFHLKGIFIYLFGCNES